ncbi:uncharacterized protein LOC142631356 [Castanea sativa]|uniref:uncharacterized protein LOC142631356 n=1 Tax=Castanea sativa TaxID=21020 RepID=UPI003F64BBAD
MQDLRVDLIEPGRLICTFKVPQHLLKMEETISDNGVSCFYCFGDYVVLQMLVIFYMVVDLVSSAVIYGVGAPATRVSVEINISYLDAAFADEEIEIEARVLRVGKAIGVVSVEFRKETGKIIAEGRHTFSFLSLVRCEHASIFRSYEYFGIVYLL